MNCRDARQHLFAERDGTLESNERAALAEHVAGCTTCQRLREQLGLVVDTWRAEVSATRVPNPDFEWQKVQRALHESPTARWKSGLAWFALPAAAAAAVAIGLYVAPPGGTTRDTTASPRVAATSPNAAGAVPASTVVYVDEQSGWTFVWSPEAVANGQHI